MDDPIDFSSFIPEKLWRGGKILWGGKGEATYPKGKKGLR
jgi:hypothetical protein